jgi:aspartate kinase
MKFGGTSVKDQAAIERLIAIVRRQAPDVAVVVSALGGATDRLLAVARAAEAGALADALAEIEGLRQRHHAVSAVIADSAAADAIGCAIDTEFNALAEITTALARLGDTSPRWLDAIAATGELLSSRIVAAALSSHGVPAAWIDARRVMVTDDEFTRASPRMRETSDALAAAFAPYLAKGVVPVIGGFVGATSAGVTTTLGRGGSDFTGAIVGAALDAREIQIWTDVDGMLTADPRLIPAARVVEQLSFAEASELAHFGAKVLHPATILPAVAKNIPVRILNSHNATAPGTLITAAAPAGRAPRPLTAIASKTGITVVDVTSTRMVMAHGFLRRLFEVFERHKTAVDVVTTSEASVSVTVDDVRSLPAIVEDLSAFADVSAERDMAILCAVGDGLPANPTVAGQLLSALDGVPLRMVSQAAARRNVTIVLRASDMPAALERWHERFIAGARAAADDRAMIAERVPEGVR